MLIEIAWAVLKQLIFLRFVVILTCTRAVKTKGSITSGNFIISKREIDTNVFDESKTLSCDKAR